MGALPGKVNTTSPVPSSSSRCLSPSCPSGLLIVLMPWGSAGAVHAQSQALGQMQPNASLRVLADPFYPRQPLTRGRGAGTAWVGGQSPSAALHGLGQCRYKCPVKCSITPVREAPRGLGQPGALPRPGGTCESSPGLAGLQGSPGSPPVAGGATWR